MTIDQAQDIYRVYMPQKRILINLGIALAYLITARLGLLLALQPGFATAYWPPSGIAVAAILLLGYGPWPGIFLGSLAANLLTPVGSWSTSIIVSTVIAVGSTLQAMAIGYFLHTLTNSMTHLLNRRRNVITFLFFSLLCCMISATISLAALYIADVVPLQSLGANWLTWWLGDTTGIYIYTPFIFALSRPHIWKDMSRVTLEGIFLFLITIGLTLLCFGGWLKAGYPIEYILIPCLIWGTFRFRPPIVIFLLVLISLIAIWGTVHGYGPFIRPTRNESLLLLQAFIGVIAGTTLIMLAAVNEIIHAQKVLEEYSQELKGQVEKLRKE